MALGALTVQLTLEGFNGHLHFFLKSFFLFGCSRKVSRQPEAYSLRPLQLLHHASASGGKTVAAVSPAVIVERAFSERLEARISREASSFEKSRETQASKPVGLASV
ncbi:hypothetical protein cyc_01195 [Cyclospora cayetanensis]|uniref:Uncharacterized protein n=1 Tax=Cyclospora cayetanensis TaxID=88456 RepID=A0A1D3CXY1_9EIME|nr:hypothetical protein cyc_01195 [Cyclospora cayetanensis]